MSQEVRDEITAVNSIYGIDLISAVSGEDGIFSLTFPARSGVSLRCDFPLDYPDTPITVLGTRSVGDDATKGEGSMLLQLARNSLGEVYVPGSPVLFDLVEEVHAQLERITDIDIDSDAPVEAQPDSMVETELTQHSYELDEEPSWMLSDVVTEKKSVFVARAASVSSVEEAKAFLAYLLQFDKKVAKATHNMSAWRIRGDNSIQYQDCDDDGETAAGSRLLHLLELMGIWNVMVVVTRWYGGVHLGPDRFRIINQTARDALVKGGFANQSSKHSKKQSKR